MRIGILGAGHIGSTLAKKYVMKGHKVFIANSRGPQSLTKVVEETGATAVSATDVVKNVDVVIVSITLKSIPLLPKDLFDGVPKDVPVIDTCNYYPMRDGVIEVLESGMPHSVWVSEQLGRPVIKAFNSILTYSLIHLGQPENTQGRIALPVAGDDLNAKKIAMELVNDAGFDAVDSGTLEESWRQHPGTPVYCTDFKAEELKVALSVADKDLTPTVRDLALQRMDTLRQAIGQVNQSSGYTLNLTLQDMLDLGDRSMNDMTVTINRSSQMELLLKQVNK